MTASIILSDNGTSSGQAGLKTSAGNDGTLQLQTTNASGTAVTALTVDNSQNPTFANAINVPNTFGFKNRIINGAMGIAQRGSSFTSVGNSGSTPAYTLDRFFGWRGGWTANMDISQQSGWSSYKNCLRMQRTNGTSSTQVMVMAQIIESVNCYDLAGQSVTISAGFRAGANYSGGQVSFYIYFSTAADQTSSGLANGTWTGVSSGGTNLTINTVGTQYSTTVAVPSNALSMAVQINWTPSGTAGAADYIEFTGVQLEKGSTATSFDYRPYGTELQLCQRYYEFGGNNSFIVVTNIIGRFPSRGFMVWKRATPTMTIAPVGGSGAAVSVDASGFYQSTNNSADSTCNWTASAEL